MGNCCLPSRFRRTHSALKPKNVTLLLLGLDNAGKTTIVKRLAGEPVDSVVPTVGFSVVSLRQRGCHVAVFDLGGGPQIRDIWPRYYADAHGVIFVTDAHDTEKMEECRQVLEKLLRNEKISGKPILLLANKQDVEGALDEIDIVDRLNLEQVVNEQKCPTLVELCSALNFSKKVDIGIENGYKWLIRSIIRDYPSLNNRVLKDLAKQEEQNKVEVIRKPTQEEETEVFTQVNGIPFKPVKVAQEEKNGYSVHAKRRPVVNSTIPGQVEEPRDRIPRPQRVPALPPLPSAKSSANSYSSEFFIVEKFQSDLQLLNDVPNHTLKNFLVRPKSSGARLYGVKSEKKTHRRKPLSKGNKTRPGPFTDISNGQEAPVPRALQPAAHVRKGPRTDWENSNPFVVSKSARGLERGEFHEMRTIDSSKSVPNSRRNSVNSTKKRRHSVVNGKMEVIPKCTNREILLDVTRIRN